MKQCTFIHCRVSYLSSFGFFNTPQTISLLDPSEYFDHYIPYITVTPCETLHVRIIKYFMLYSGRERSLVSYLLRTVRRYRERSFYIESFNFLNEPIRVSWIFWFRNSSIPRIVSSFASHGNLGPHVRVTIRILEGKTVEGSERKGHRQISEGAE